jgi:CubicO group peptidase (beta-lactamase class C family)
MAAVLTRATKTPLDVYAEQKLFRPLGIAKVEWHKDARGVPFAASGLRMTPRDMAKVGQLVLANGRWNGRQVIPARWVRDATRPHAVVQPGDPKCGTRYGYFWWLYQGCQVTPPEPWAAGVGLGAQRIMVMRGRDTVVVMTAGLYNSRRQSEVANAVATAVLGAVK